ncbi:hypothetical protein Mapa_000120 [Marchantia paleacea]|nr:hypothetical protein Mapa_000120 [Marchantia paleacea]
MDGVIVVGLTLKCWMAVLDMDFSESKSRELWPDLCLSGAVAIALERVRIWAYLHAFERSLPPHSSISHSSCPFSGPAAAHATTLFWGFGSLVLCGDFGATTSLVISRSVLAPDLLPRSWSTISHPRHIFSRSGQRRGEREMGGAFGPCWN